MITSASPDARVVFTAGPKDMPGYFILSYRDIVFNTANASIPTIGGQHVNYTPAKVFDSPYLSADYASGVVTIRKGALTQVYDFGPGAR